MAHSCTLNAMFDCNIEKWTKYFTFMDDSTSRAVTASRFVRLVAKLSCAKIEKRLSKVVNVGRELRLTLPSLSIS